MRVDVSRQDEFAGAIDGASAKLHHHIGGDIRDAPVVDENRRVTGNFSISGIYDGSANERDFFGVSSEREDRQRKSECDSKFHADSATWQNKNEPVISVALTSTLPFYYSRCFAIDRSVIGFARSQIKFVGGNLEKRGSRHGKNHPEKPEHRPGGKCEE